MRKVSIDKISVHEPKYVDRILRGVLANHVGLECKHGIRELTVIGLIHSEQTRIALFSSVAATTSLECLAIEELSDANQPNISITRCSMLQWLAFALFSKFSLSSVKSLKLSLQSLSEHDVASMAEILSTENPLRILLHSSTSECKTVTLLSKKNIIVDGTTVSIPCGTVMWVVHEQTGEHAMDVLVPGYGVYPVARAILGEPSTPLPSTPVSSLAFYSYEYRRSGGDPEVLLLLNLVGQYITSLSFAGMDFVPDACLMIEACPNLKRLELSDLPEGLLEDVNCFVDAFQSESCRISSLSLQNQSSRTWLALPQFFRALGDPDKKNVTTTR